MRTTPAPCPRRRQMARAIIRSLQITSDDRVVTWTKLAQLSPKEPHDIRHSIHPIRNDRQTKEWTMAPKSKVPLNRRGDRTSWKRWKRTGQMFWCARIARMKTHNLSSECWIDEQSMGGW
jgi:hypothetical protein